MTSDRPSVLDIAIRGSRAHWFDEDFHDKWGIRDLGVAGAAQYKRMPNPFDALSNRAIVRASTCQIGFEVIRLDQHRIGCEDVLQGPAG